MAASKEIKHSFGGIQIRDINEINIGLICELCKLLQLHPVQLLCCGTRLCRWCSEKGVPNREPFVCPFCQAKQPTKQAQADRGVERELNMIEKVGCYSCSWDGSYKEYQKHLQQHHEHLKCSDCHARFYAKNSYEEHRQEICEHRCIPCGLPGCLELVRPSEMHGHYLSAKHQETLVKCIIKYFTRLNSEHDQMISNWQPTIFNPNNIRLLNMIEKVGCYACSWDGPYKEYEKHLQQQHAYLACSDCQARFYAINSYEEHRQEICEYRSILCGLPGCDELIKSSEMKTHYLCDKHQKQLIRFIINFFFQKKHLSYDSSRLTTTSNIVNTTGQELAIIDESVGILLPGLESLSTDCTRFRIERNQIKTTCERIISQINESKKKINEDNEKLLQCVQSQNQTEPELDDTKKLYTSINTLLLDERSTMIFSFRINTEEIHSSFSMSSPPFKTSPYGYSFMLRVCSTNEYLSIYLTLLRTDFDQILTYPFPYNISLCLYDQSGQGKHITSIIEPARNSLSFTRPTSERNNEVGITQFCRLNTLTDVQSIHLKDGGFSIHIFFDFMNTGSIPI